MKHLLYLLLAGSLLTEQPLYGAKKKGKKTRKIGKKGTIGKKGGASSVAVATSQPLTPTPTQTTKTEAPQTAVITKQQAQKLIDGYLEKHRKEIQRPLATIAAELLIAKQKTLTDLVQNRMKRLISFDPDKLSEKIESLITIFDNKNNIDINKAKTLKEEFNTIVENLKQDLPNKIKENKTEKQKIVKDLETTISNNFTKSMGEKNDNERKRLQTEMATLQKEKKTIEEQYPQCIETILTIHKAALSFFENDILKDFFEKLIKENSTKQSLAEYNKKKGQRYADKITQKNNKQSEENEKINKELEEKINKEKDPTKKEELKRELNRRKTKKAPLKYGQTSKETSKKINSEERENIKKSLLEFQKSTEMKKIDKLKDFDEKNSSSKYIQGY